MKTLDNIIKFINDNPNVEHVTWRDVKIANVDDTWYAIHEYVWYSDPWDEDDMDYNFSSSISVTKDLDKFKTDILDWLGVD